MDNNHLDFFEELIRVAASAGSSFTFETVKAFAKLSADDIQEEKNKMLRVFRNLKFQILDEKQIEWVINAYHERLVQLFNEFTTIIDYSNDEVNSNNKLKFMESWVLKGVCNVFTELITNIELIFSKYLDLNSYIPIAYETKLKEKITHSVVDFRNSTEAPVCKDLRKILLDVLDDFIESEPGRITYLKFHFLSTLLHSLTRPEVIQGEQEQFTERLQHVLFELNFNNENFIKYILNKYKAEVEGLPNNEKLTIYSCRLKEINQLTCRTGFSFNPIAPSLQHQINTWLKEEVIFLKEICHIKPDKYADEPSKWDGFKIETNASVPQLGNIIRLFFEVGIFQNENKTEMLEFLSKHFATTKTENISAGSLRKHFYNDDASVSEAVRSILIAMINRSNGKK